MSSTTTLQNSGSFQHCVTFHRGLDSLLRRPAFTICHPLLIFPPKRIKCNITTPACKISPVFLCRNVSLSNLWVITYVLNQILHKLFVLPPQPIQTRNTVPFGHPFSSVAGNPSNATLMFTSRCATIFDLTRKLSLWFAIHMPCISCLKALGTCLNSLGYPFGKIVIPSLFSSHLFKTVIIASHRFHLSHSWLGCLGRSHTTNLSKNVNNFDTSVVLSNLMNCQGMCSAE